MYFRVIIGVLDWMSDLELIRWLTSPLPETGRSPQDHIALDEGEQVLAAAQNTAYWHSRSLMNGHMVAS